MFGASQQDEVQRPATVPTCSNLTRVRTASDTELQPGMDTLTHSFSNLTMDTPTYSLDDLIQDGIVYYNDPPSDEPECPICYENWE
jgi:hypothetical protein